MPRCDETKNGTWTVPKGLWLGLDRFSKIPKLIGGSPDIYTYINNSNAEIFTMVNLHGYIDLYIYGFIWLYIMYFIHNRCSNILSIIFILCLIHAWKDAIAFSKGIYICNEYILHAYICEYPMTVSKGIVVHVVIHILYIRGVLNINIKGYRNSIYTYSHKLSIECIQYY